jgi:hypothetical protein
MTYFIPEDETETINIKTEKTFDIQIDILPSTIAILQYEFSCLDSDVNAQFCDILSAEIVSVGENIYGFYKSYLNGISFYQPVIQRTNTNHFYKDTVSLNFGIVSNTGKHI